MAANLQNTTSKLLDSNGVTRRWIVVLCEMYSHTLSDALLNVWLSITKSIEPKRLEEGFKKLAETFVPTSACPFPVPAHLWEKFEMETDSLDFAKMNDAWQRIDSALNSYGYESFGWTPQELFCVRCAGGWSALVNATITDFQWMKKRFCEAWIRWNEMPEESKALPSAEFCKLVEEHYKR